MTKPSLGPIPRFARFEKVTIVGDAARLAELRGASGVVAWRDFQHARNTPDTAAHWLYVVHVPDRERWPTVRESDLRSEGTIAPPESLLGLRHEISFDLVMSDDMNWAEGTYRRPGEFWSVFIASTGDVAEVECRPQTWDRRGQPEGAVAGVGLKFPRGERINRESIRRALSHFCGGETWTEVRGPDSMVLR